MVAGSRPSSLHRDAVALYDAATAFIRIYQFRDRDQALRFGLTVVQAYTLDILLYDRRTGPHGACRRPCGSTRAPRAESSRG